MGKRSIAGILVTFLSLWIGIAPAFAFKCPTLYKEAKELIAQKEKAGGGAKAEPAPRRGYGY